MIEASAGVISAGEPMAEDPMTAHEMSEIDDDKLEALGLSLAATRDEWVVARKASGVEKRWMEDLDQYHGRDASTKAAASMMDAAEAGYPVTNQGAKAQRSTLYVNITRPKTNAVEARLANMLFPSDDRNWGIKPSPAPELIKQAMAEALAGQVPQGQDAPAATPAPTASGPQSPLPPGVSPTAAAPQMGAPPAAPGMPSQIVAPGLPSPGGMPVPGIMAAQQPAPPTATAQLEEATSRCKAMQDEIDDQLIDCQYNGEGRKLLHDVCVIGTGIIKGPIIVNRMRKAWAPMKDSPDPSVYVLEIVKEVKPASESISPWHVFPDPSCGGDVHNGRGIFEYRNMTSKQLRELSKQPGYLADKIGAVLEAGPDDSPMMTDRDERTKEAGGNKVRDKEHYQLWEYWGEFSPDDLRSAGVDIDDSSTESVSGCIVFINSTVIKGFLNPCETGDLPYDFMQCELVDESPWGYGIPFLMRPSSRALTAAWRQLMDNSGMTIGPQVIMKRKGISPANGQWEIKGNKVWLADDEIDVRQAFSTFDIPHHGEIIQQIIELAMKFADEEASIPAIAQGEKGNAPDTVGGITILMNNANVVLGRYIKQFDDCITRPHIRRYYDWNMAYSSKANLKGDFQVDARGSSALLVRDVQAQALLALGQYQGSGIIAPFVNWESWFKEILKLQHIDPAEIMKTDAEIAQIASAPAQATPEQIRAQAATQVAQIRAGAAQQVASAKVQGELAYAQKMQEIEQQNAAARQQERQDELQLEILKYSNAQKVSLQDAQAQLADRAMQEKTKRDLAATAYQFKASESHAHRDHQINMASHGAALDALQQQEE